MNDGERPDAGVDAVFRELRREFLAGLSVRAERIRGALSALAAAYQQEQAEAVYLAAHSLEGTAPSFGAPELVGPAETLAGVAREWVRRRVAPASELTTAADALAALEAAASALHQRWSEQEET